MLFCAKMHACSLMLVCSLNSAPPAEPESAVCSSFSPRIFKIRCGDTKQKTCFFFWFGWYSWVVGWSKMHACCLLLVFCLILHHPQNLNTTYIMFPSLPCAPATNPHQLAPSIDGTLKTTPHSMHACLWHRTASCHTTTKKGTRVVPRVQVLQKIPINQNQRLCCNVNAIVGDGCTDA